MMLVIGAFFAGATPAMATHSGSDGQQCITQKIGGNPSCTANDVRVGTLDVVPGGPVICDVGEMVTLDVIATIESGPQRFDIGVWLNESGGSAKDDADGTCFRDYLHNLGTPTVCDQQGGPYWDEPSELDNDVCGDVYADNTNPCGNKVTGPCSDGSGGTCLFTTFEFTFDYVCADSAGTCDNGDFCSPDDPCQTGPCTGDGRADVGTCSSWV